ncbi:VanZ family protein [Psychroflexus sp. ALD_RP9]|uniref:VanZ family protein n=1 Tax=Psychroflexus sp. ALD_RP9 TaxID=2777186 RepID=UPI001A8C2C67|nr:VanZ family protein [Psychroflexus sp. ALD_RP9]QSS96148.1 VanZ family protein [Psychroflexus sp. ALD_RP9]
MSNIPSIGTENSDKVYHAIAYFILSTAWNLFYLNSAKEHTKIKFILSICISIILFGIVIEFLQELITSYRTFDVNDMFANSIGCISAAIVFAILLEKLKIKWLKFN